MPKLSARRVATLHKPGMYGDGEGLYLHVGPSGTKSWILRTAVHGRRRELGLGSASLVPLAEAREMARSLRKVAREGGDPETARDRDTLSFREAAKKVHENLLPTWRNEKHAQTWLATIESYANPAFGSRPIASVGTSDVLKVLSPIWTTKHETAKRLRQRLSTVFDWAKGAGHYPHENPVNGLKKALPAVKRRAKHMPAMAWQDVPAFMSALSERDGVSARTLEFIILTAARSGEARGARWSEVERGVWNIPAERMKRGVPHRVPLSEEALGVLEKMRGLDGDLIFPSVKRGPRGESRPQSVMVFKALLDRMERTGFTVHGFRSTFRDWCSESAHAEREIAEAALSHATGNEVERAYARSDLFERRLALMDAWARYATGKTGAVVQMVRG
ncbi:integrase [Maritimibacter sp. 55A14]|uniref:tyrosine-type recombinase/integrase n=1 Tax=Maritimibacter sp. 55A14 TaxID=2174844 RepID=UPI000D61D103|nr:site-specific integrase [Maritimibacter sp. 55A14]PWE29243.1 integrase [Maritimibacter sp. 55A14]